jgi:hypothetical protein
MLKPVPLCGRKGPNDYSHLLPFFFKSIYSIFPCGLINELRAQLTTLMITEPRTAAQNPRTSNPEITPDAILSNRALMIKVKRPRVRILMGRVRIISMGRKKAFKTPRIAAAKNALKKPLTWMLSNTYEATMIAAVKTSHLMSIPFISITSFIRYLAPAPAGVVRIL